MGCARHSKCDHQHSENTKNIEQNGKKFIFVVAPDKSSVYQSCMLGGKPTYQAISNINNFLISAGVNAPNLRNIFTDKVNAISDLYEPDNTHWSIAGYKLAGQTVAQYISTKVVQSEAN